MGDFIFPLQFKRQYSAPLDLDLVFTTTANRIAYLTRPRRYAGQIVTDLEDGKIYRLNSTRDEWIDISVQGSTRYLALTGGQVYGNVTIHGDLSSSGTQTFANTLFTTTSALSVRNFGVSTALFVSQDGSGDIASFYDADSEIEVLHIGGDHSLNNFVGVRTGTPNKEFTVNGEISAGNNIWTGGKMYAGSGNSDNWNSVFTSSSRASATWDSAYTTVSAASAFWERGPVFANDLFVSLSNNKTFGRYGNGSVIPAAGKTPAQVIQLALVEPITPAAFITPVTTSLAFNTQTINNVLNFSHSVSSLGATIEPDSGRIEWRRNNTGAWTLLSSTVITPAQFTHSTTNDAYNTQPFNYRYIVSDTAGASVTATNNVTIAAYSAPTVTSFSLAATNTLTSPETNLIRERGNISSNISGTINRVSTLVPLVSYTIEYQVNGGGSWIDTNLGGQILNNPSSVAVTNVTHNPTANIEANSLSYRFKVVDQYQQSLNAQATITPSSNTATFYYLAFYGPVSATPVNSGDIRLTVPTRVFANTMAATFDLFTGTVQRRFTVALPQAVTSRDTISTVVNQTALNSVITTDYTNNLNQFAVNDYAGNGSTYNVYTMTNAIPYAADNRHIVTVN